MKLENLKSIDIVNDPISFKLLEAIKYTEKDITRIRDIKRKFSIDPDKQRNALIKQLKLIVDPEKLIRRTLAYLWCLNFVEFTREDGNYDARPFFNGNVHSTFQAYYERCYWLLFKPSDNSQGYEAKPTTNNSGSTNEELIYALNYMLHKYFSNDSLSGEMHNVDFEWIELNQIEEVYQHFCTPYVKNGVLVEPKPDQTPTPKPIDKNIPKFGDDNVKVASCSETSTKKYNNTPVILVDGTKASMRFANRKATGTIQNLINKSANQYEYYFVDDMGYKVWLGSNSSILSKDEREAFEIQLMKRNKVKLL